MHLHHLELQNIGPFSGTTTLDFASLSSAGLFLLEGPTGSGKSTILDAIVYALYGQVAGPHASSGRMRSQFASADDDAVVTLTFETNAGVFRIRRTPSYQRPKRSGEGTTSQQATVKLWRIADPESTEGELLSTRHGEVETEVYRIVGLSRSQFVQTVLLPQGEFANFLRAKPEDRRELLQRLFDTQLFEDVTEALERARRDSANQRLAVVTRSAHAKTALATAAELSTERGQAITEASPALLRVEVDHIEREAAESLGEARTQLELAEKVAAETSAEFTIAHGYRAAWTEREALRAESQALNAKGPWISELREKVDRFDIARGYQGLQDERNEAGESHGIVVSLIADRTQEVELADQPLDEAIHASRTLIAELAKLEATEAELTLISDRIESLQVELFELAQTQSAIATDLDRAPAALAELRSRLATAQVWAAALAKLEQDVDAEAQRVEAATKASTVAAERGRCHDRVRELDAAARKAASDLQSVQAQRIAGISGELAASLEDGLPCSVCGSKEHPAPAIAPAGSATAEDVDVAAARLDSLVDELSNERRRHDVLEEQYAALHARAAGRTVAECQQRYGELVADLSQARAADEERGQLEAEVSEFESNQQRQQEQLVELSSEATKRGDERERLTRQFTEAQAVIATARAEHDSIAARRLAEETRLLSLGELQTQTKRAAELAARLSVLDKQWDGALQVLGLESDAQFRALRAEASATEDARALVEAHDADSARVAFGLAQLGDDFESDALTEEELAEMEQAAVAAARARDDRLSHFGHVEALVNNTRRHVAQLRDALAEEERVHVQTADVIRVAELAAATSPDNLKRIPLPTYVLIERFREVLVAANARLQEMSNGRFTLEHQIQLEARGRKSGLGLVVHDHFVGQDRDPGNLSGGETFYTSLALALGLADVVVAESGGVDLGTLFIDEGFGSLDGDTLDAVLGEIDKLRSGGRVVGVVSHVEELKQRINERIEIRLSSIGRSTVRILA